MIVSNTEISMFNTCKRSHYYRFRLGVEPRSHLLSLAIRRGLAGHQALDIYYTDIKEGKSISEAHDHAVDTIKSITALEVTMNLDNPNLPKIVGMFEELVVLIGGYAQYWEQDPFEVIETESFHKTQMDNGIEYGLRLDLLAKYLKGEWAGNLVLIDHKFVYNFKTQAELDQDAQLSKYIPTLRAEGYSVNRGMFNQIRTRKLKNPSPVDLYRRVIVRPTKAKINNIFREQELVSEEIVELSNLSIEEHSEKATRNLSPHICRGCFFQTICNQELEEQSIEKSLISDYQANSYGYAELSEE